MEFAEIRDVPSGAWEEDMRFGPVEFVDRQGRTVSLRNAEEADADDLIRFLKVTTGETPFLLRESDEVRLTKEQEKAFIRNNIEAERELFMIATLDGRLAGSCSVMSAGPYRRYAHRCSVAIALYREFCGCGIGAEMMRTLLDLAKEMGYEQAELEVISDNKRAIALYEKLGFREYGRFPRNMKYADGSYADAAWMMKRL